PRSIYLLDFLICLLATTGVRVFTRIAQESLHNRRQIAGEKAVLIYGAGGAGVTLLREIRSNAALKYKVLGFVDDNPQKRGVDIQGVKVLGSGNALAALTLKHRIGEVLIALPSATGPEMTTILTRCHQVGVRCRTIPALAEVIEGRALAHQIRDVAVEDLLGRTPVRLKQSAISARLGGRVVLVTGAAGSIGSELCRQIARFRPSAIVGFEIAETALFHLERELRQSFPDLLFHPEIGSIQDPDRLDEVFRTYSPALLYHAAAYKHVPMMETHVFEAVKNNVLGTYNVALAATRHGVEDFVMISTDKAVHPTSIMGATKRLAELLILSLQNGGMKYVSVRFGNVLGSNGSVVPIFKQQIAAGGPMTVTHPEMRRYFMTIPEASQLVLQASTMGNGGEIFVLDMGVPVKIVDLARNLILLSGLRPDQDIKIEFTGIRPGEKLYEELNSLEEDTLPTPHEKIKIFAGNGLPSAGMESYIETLRDICAHRDLSALILTLKEIAPDYNPSAHVLQKAFHDSPATPVAA
ncbi:polysaccharide biosynthesis protein, partial [bacterium]